MVKQHEVFEHAQLLQIEASEGEASAARSTVEGPQRGVSRKLLAVAGAAALLVGGCATAASLAGPKSEHVSARELLESPEMTDAAASNLVRFDSHHEPAQIRAYVASGLKTITRKMSSESPEAFRQLEAMQFSPEQKAGVVRMVTHLSDDRVQDLGYEVYRTMHEDKSKGREELKKDLLKKFSPRATELRQLRDEIVPESLREASQQGGDAVLDLERTHLFENFENFAVKHQDDLHIESRRLTAAHSAHATIPHPHAAPHQSVGGEMTPQKAKAMDVKIEDAAGIIGALLEQARIALDAGAVIAPTFGKKQPISWLARSMVGGADFAVETGDCIMRQNDHGKEYNSVKLAMCPMKYASALMDLLSGVNNAMGIQNGNLPQEMNTMMGGNLKSNPGYAAAAAAAQKNPEVANNFLSSMMQQHPTPAQGANFLSNKMTQHPQGAQANSWLANMMKHPAAQASSVVPNGSPYANPAAKAGFTWTGPATSHK